MAMFFCLVLFVLFYRKEKLLTFSKAQWAGAIAYFLMAYFYIAATQLTTAANAILLQYTAPVYVALLSIWLLKEKVKKGLVCYCSRFLGHGSFLC